MNEIEIALAVSAREWPDRIHRFLADHGGARVRAQILTPEDALAESYAILVIDDVSSFLTPRLVADLQLRRRLVLGVFDPADGPDGKERLRECGVDQVIESEASADEFVVTLRSLVALAPVEPGTAIEPRPPSPRSRLIAVASPPGGCGATEVAVGIAARLGQGARTVLVDVDEVAPAVAQRLNLQLLPNLRSAIDVIQHRNGTLEGCLHSLPGISVLPGLSGDRDWIEVRPLEVLNVLTELRVAFGNVVANLGPHLEQVGFGDTGRFGISRAVLQAADVVVGVGLPHPVGISRLMGWALVAADLNPGAFMSVVINRAPRSKFRRSEIERELGRVLDGEQIHFLPHDEQVEVAAWAGQPVGAGRFSRSLRRLCDRSLAR